MTELIKIGIVFFIVLVLTFRNVKLWIGLLAGTFLMGILFHLPIKMIMMNVLTATLDKRTLLLLGAFIAILLFSSLLKETGRMQEILEGFRNIFKDIRVVIAMLPAMIGLMPIAGGALVSAPMVVEGSDELRLSPERRTFINYWFRHVWEYVLPTYPALILAATLMGVPVRKIGWVNLPLTLTAILSGALIGFWGVSRSMRGGPLSNATSHWRFFANLCPLLFALILVVVFQVELVYAFGVTILGMAFLYRMHWRLIGVAFKQSLNIELLLSVAIVMGFKKVLESSQAVQAVSQTLSSSGVPLWFIAFFVPFLIALIMGLTWAPVAIGFPILIPLLENDPNYFNYMMLGFAGVVSGDLLSPFHLCLILTKDYFRAELKGVYRFIWVPVGSVLAVAVLLTFLR